MMPLDYARCMGKENEAKCQGCARSQDWPKEARLLWMAPAIQDGTCDSFEPLERWAEVEHAGMINLEELDSETENRLEEAISFLSEVLDWLEKRVTRHLGTFYGCPGAGCFETLVYAQHDCDCEAADALLGEAYRIFDINAEMLTVKGAIFAIQMTSHVRRKGSVWFALPKSYGEEIKSVMDGNMPAFYAHFGCTPGDAGGLKLRLLRLIREVRHAFMQQQRVEAAHV